MAPSSEQYAELAALFTTGNEAEQVATIELLLPAHLPVQGGLWLVPYAGREVAQGLSILVRMHEETIDVAGIGQGNFDLTTCRSIEDVLEAVDVPIVNWIIQPPSDADPTSLLHCDADCVTLLSGADQAAVVGAYRLLKGLISAAGNDELMPSMQLVIVGAEERAARDAASRIVQTAHHQLGVNIEVGIPLPAMGSSNNIVSQVSFSRTSNVIDLMSRIRNYNETDEVNSMTQQVEGKPEPNPKTQIPIVPSTPTPTPPIAAEVVEVIAPPPPKTPKTPKTPTTPQPISTPSETDSLVSHVEGLLAINPRCPEHEHVELAVDCNGCVHILADAGDIRDATIVSAWLVRHHALIALACAGLQIDENAIPVQHLFTDDAVQVADLHGSGVRLHLLVEVEVQGNVGKFCTPLN